MHKSCLANGWLALLSTSILDPFMSKISLHFGCKYRTQVDPK